VAVGGIGLGRLIGLNWGDAGVLGWAVASIAYLAPYIAINVAARRRGIRIARWVPRQR
jgi:hypothetical protein